MELEFCHQTFASSATVPKLKILPLRLPLFLVSSFTVVVISLYYLPLSWPIYTLNVEAVLSYEAWVTIYRTKGVTTQKTTIQI